MRFSLVTFCVVFATQVNATENTYQLDPPIDQPTALSCDRVLRCFEDENQELQEEGLNSPVSSAQYDFKDHTDCRKERFTKLIHTLYQTCSDKKMSDQQLQVGLSILEQSWRERTKALSQGQEYDRKKSLRYSYIRKVCDTDAELEKFKQIWHAKRAALFAARRECKRQVAGQPPNSHPSPTPLNQQNTMSTFGGVSTH